MKSSTNFPRGRWAMGLVALLTVLLMACGGAQEPAAQQTTTAPVDAGGDKAPADTKVPAPVDTKVSPADAKPARDSAVLVTEAEPAAVGRWSSGASHEVHSFGSNEFPLDFMTWIDGKSFEVVLLSGVESYKQLGPDLWEFKIRPGVKFHNGVPFDAEQAAFGIDYNADRSNPGSSNTFPGPDLKGIVVDELTFNVKCPVNCPILPRTTITTSFQERGWWDAATDAEKAQMTMGFGPYKITDYQPGIHTKFEIYDDYVPNEEVFDAQFPHIQNMKHVYRAEASVRAGMIVAGEADWVADIGFEEGGRVNHTETGTTAEVYTLIPDTVFHPELSKQKVRLALLHAIDCQGLLDSLFGKRIQCWGSITMQGTVGITPENSAPREYDPVLAKQLLEEAGYSPENAIDVNTRPGSNIRGLEIMEAVVQYWKDVGVTSNLNSWGDLASARKVQLAGCGQFVKTDPTYKEKLDCAGREPPEPYFASSHTFEVATSNEILDQQRFNNSRMNCLNRGSHVCDPELQKQMIEANQVVAGQARQDAMAEILQIAYDEVYFMPLFQVVYVYGLADDLVWTPYYAPGLRGNSMWFEGQK